MKWTFQKLEDFVKTNVSFQPLNIFAKKLSKETPEQGMKYVQSQQ